MYCRRSPQSFVLGARDVLKVLKKPVLPVGKVEVCTLIQFSTVVIQSNVRDNKKSLIYCSPFKFNLTRHGDIEKNPGPQQYSNFDLIQHTITDSKVPGTSLFTDLNLTPVNLDQELTRKPLIHFSSHRLEGPCYRLLSVDIETKNKNDIIVPPFRTANETIDFFHSRSATRKREQNTMNSSTDVQRQQWIDNQEVLVISIVISHFDGISMKMDHSMVLYTGTDRLVEYIDECDQLHDVFHFTTESSMLERFSNILNMTDPHFILGHNIKKFDIPVLLNRARINHVNLEFPRVSSVSLLTEEWKSLVTDQAVLDTLEYANKYVDIKYGNSLANLSYKLLAERKMEIVPKFPRLLPCDVLDLGEGYCIRLLTYSFTDVILSTKLFLLFQMGSQSCPSYKVMKKSSHKFFKHDEIHAKVMETVYKYHILRSHVSMCFGSWLEALLQRDDPNMLIPVNITSQTYYAVASILDDIAGKSVNANFPDSRSSTYGHLVDFINGTGQFHLNSSTPGFQLLLPTNERNELLSDMFLNIGSRPFAYMSLQLFDNLRTTIKTTYRQYVHSLINKIFEKDLCEHLLTEYCKEDIAFRGYSRLLRTAFRYQLKQIKEVFFKSCEEFNLLRSGDLPTLAEFNQKLVSCVNALIEKKFEKYSNNVHPLNISKQFMVDTAVQLVESLTDDTFVELFFSGFPTGFNNYPNLVDVIYPQQFINFKGQVDQVQSLSQALSNNSVFFLSSSMIISSVIESKGGRPFQIFPLVSDFTPGHMDIDSRVMAAIVNKTIDGVALTDYQKSCLGYSPTHVAKMNFEQQQDYWRNLVNFPQIRSPLYRFGNTVSTNGIFTSIQNTRRDLVGKPRGSKPDAAHDTKLAYITDKPREFFTDKKILFCDPGKKDVLMLGTLTNEAPVESVDYSSTTARDFSFSRLTHNHWIKQDRTNRGILEWAKEHCFDPQESMSIKQWETRLSLTPSRTTVFDRFRLFVTAKAQTQIKVKSFYTLHIWRIQKMQNFCHRRSVLDKLTNTVSSKLNVIDPKNSIIVYGDWSEIKLKCSWTGKYSW
ncbi:hypothetical protein RCL1_003001 [Eukaryota sp. TZLM3-RCL]